MPPLRVGCDGCEDGWKDAAKRHGASTPGATTDGSLSIQGIRRIPAAPCALRSDAVRVPGPHHSIIPHRLPACPFEQKKRSRIRAFFGSGAGVTVSALGEGQTIDGAAGGRCFIEHLESRLELRTYGEERRPAAPFGMLVR